MEVDQSNNFTSQSQRAGDYDLENYNNNSDKAACSVRVALRVRPLVGRELFESPNICVTCYPEQDQIVIGKDRVFTFDKVFDIGTRQQDIFDSCVKNLVLGCFAGYNATVLAYGQTGSGKTFTMGSGYTIGLKEEELGIIPRVIKLIFDEVDKRKHKAEFIIKCSFLEIYNEELNDLLDHGQVSAGGNAAVIDRFMQKKDITIREEKNGNISVFGLREEKVNSYEELASCLDRGSNFRSTASTLMNNCSSRSHAIFTISIEQHVIDDLYQPNQPAATSAEHEEFMVAKFHFVDLAGSERAKRTGATGNTLKEGISINKGLLALGNVISALTEEGKKNNHVPYRDSKLTRILQDSLGGNSRTSMIACVSPAEVNFEETLNTLKYASRARNIKNKPIVNRDPNSQQIAQLRQQVYELTRELVGARKLLISNNIEFESNMNIPNDVSMIDSKALDAGHHQRDYMVGAAEIAKYEQEIKELKNLVQSKDKKINQLQTQHDHVSEQLSQKHIELFSVQKERDLSRFQLEQTISILKKRQIFEDIMNELHGYDKTPDGMEIDEQNDRITNYDIYFGSSGPTILEEYQVKVTEQSKEIAEKSALIKSIQKELETLLKSSQQDLKNLESKEQEIERLKRSVNKLQKENAQIKNEQRRGTMTIASRPQTSAPPVAPIQRKVLPTERKTQVVASPFTQIKNRVMGGPNKDPEEWISSELDQNIKQFNEQFIENLSQSLSNMLMAKKQGQDKMDDKTDMHPQHDIQEFSVHQTPQQTQGLDSDSDYSEDSGDEHMHQEIEDQILPQNEKDQQVIIESNEETKKQDEEIKSFLQQQEKQILTIEDSLKEKEELLKLVKESHTSMSNQLLEAMKNEYHKKIQQFQQEMKQLELQKIEDLKKANTDQQKSKLEDGYKKKLKELEDKLRDAKQKERDQQNLQKQQTTNKVRIQTLEKEIEKMKVQKVTMVKQMKEESEKHRKWKAERVKELMQIKQSNLKKDREIQLLKRENKRKDMFAKQKQQELSALMKRNRIEKQKQINGQKDRHQKKNIDIAQIQNWIITNTEKMLKYKELSLLLEQDLLQKNQVEVQINEEQNQCAQLSVRREKLEYQKCQYEQNDELDFSQQIYEIDEEINQIAYETKAIQENIETLEEKFDFIEAKISQINTELLQYSPDQIEQLNFDAVQSIEGARACLGAFFAILLDVNVYKKQLEAQVVQNEATIESLSQQMDQLRQTQQANEIAFQKELEQINSEYKQKEELLIRIIMENGGPEIEQLMSKLDLNGGNGKQTGTDIVKELISKTLGAKDAEDSQQPMLTSQISGTYQKRNTIKGKQLELQKLKEESYNQSKTQLSKRVAELERRTKEDQKKIESMRHKFEQTNQEKEHFKKQLDTVKQKLKNQEIFEVKQSKIPMAQDDINQQNYSTREQQKSPRHQNSTTNQQQMTKLMVLREARNDRKIKKLVNQNPTSKRENEPRVIADEPMGDQEDEDLPFVQEIKKTNLTPDQAQTLQALKAQNQPQQQQPIQSQQQVQEPEMTNVFTRLSQGGKTRPQTSMGGNGSLNNSLTINTQLANNQANDIPFRTAQTLEDDKNWKMMFNKEMAHNHNICAIASAGNQLYSTSNKSLKIWDLDNMTQISDISAHKNYIKCITIWKEKNILLTASERDIYLWDMISLTQVGKLTAHSEVKAMTVSTDGNLLFSGGKGSATQAGLLIWDLRKGSSPLDEREKNQDIFSLLATPEVLFYGCRSHQVIPFNYRTSEQYNALQPPHFDAVTSLAILDGVLVSGSRDKMFRYWDYQRYAHLSVEVAHSDQINTLETDHGQKELYSGSKDGVVKVWRFKDQRVRCTAQLTASFAGGSINTITKIDESFGRWFVTGSSDKSLKIWRWKKKDQNEMDTQGDREMEDLFEKANLEKNNDFFTEQPDQERQNDNRMFSQLNKLEEIKQQDYKVAHHQMGRSNTGPVNQFNMGGQGLPSTKNETRRRQMRLQDQQRRYQKENDQNFQQL